MVSGALGKISIYCAATCQLRDRQLRDRQALITLHPNRKKTLTNEVRWCIVGFGALALHIYVSKNPYSGQNARTSCLI
jgi:hypothetical protein